MSESRVYFGKRFYKNKEDYWVNLMPIHAHRWVWINHFGCIPKGMDIHHVDGDKSNNEIENLRMMTRSDHLKEHWKDPLLREERRKQLDVIRPKAIEWLRSEEGRQKQREDGIEAWKKRKSKKFICKCCGVENETRHSRSLFCSGACRSRWKRHNKPNPVEVLCHVCNKLFMKDKSDQKKVCSRSCGAKCIPRAGFIK